MLYPRCQENQKEISKNDCKWILKSFSPSVDLPMVPRSAANSIHLPSSALASPFHVIITWASLKASGTGHSSTANTTLQFSLGLTGLGKTVFVHQITLVRKMQKKKKTDVCTSGVCNQMAPVLVVNPFASRREVQRRSSLVRLQDCRMRIQGRW